MSDHTETISASGTWTFPSPPPRYNTIHVEAIGPGGDGGNEYKGTNKIYHDALYGNVWNPETSTWEWKIIEPAWIEYVPYCNNGGGGEQGESKMEDFVLANNNSITVTITSATTSFGSLLSCAAGNDGGNATSSANGSGGTGGPGVDGTAGGSSGGIGGGTTGAYGTGGTGGDDDSVATAGITGAVVISWDDACYCYIAEGE